MSETNTTRVRPMTVSDLDLVLGWRNHPEVSRFMCSQHKISVEEHAKWFARVSQDPERHLLLFEINSTPLGFINIFQDASSGIAEWGFYVAPDAPPGSGRALGEAGLLFTFETLGVKRLRGRVLAENHRSIRFHRNLGFQLEGVLHQHHFDGKTHHDVVCFELLASEWLQKN